MDETLRFGFQLCIIGAMKGLTTIAVFCIATALLFARAPDALLAPQFWAEDASVFWLQQYQRGLVASLFQPYAGYLHVMARLIAGFASAFPYAMQPAIFVAAAAAVTGWTSATIAAISLPRFLAALLGIGAVAVAPGEVLATPTNLQWIMAAALPLIAVTAAPTGTFARANQLIFVTLAGLTGPFSILMLPIWAWCAVSHRHERFALLLAGVAIATGLIQMAFVMGADSVRAQAPDLLGTASTLLQRVATEAFGLRLRAVGLVLLPLLVASAAIGRYRHVRCVSLIFAGLVLVGVAWKYSDQPVWLATPGAGERYFYLPTAMIAVCALTLLFERLARAALGVACSILLGLHLARHFVRIPAENFSRAWSEKSPLIGTQQVEVPIAPNWTMTIPPR